MKHKRPLFISTIFLAAVACQQQDSDDRADAENPGASANPQQPVAAPDITAAFADPFAYCTALGTIDAPDVRYTGPQSPAAIDTGLQQAAGDAGGGFTWRCMDGDVYACRTTGDTRCRVKPEFSRTGNAAMQAFCRENPNAFSIPASVAGPATAYEWQCDGTEPFVEERIVTADRAGFRADLWYRIERPQPAAETQSEPQAPAESDTGAPSDAGTGAGDDGQ